MDFVCSGPGLILIVDIKSINYNLVFNMVNFTFSFFILYQYSILNSAIMGRMKQCNFMKYRNVKLCLYQLLYKRKDYKFIRKMINLYNMMLLYHSDLCPLSAFNYRSPNLDCGFVNKVWPGEGPQYSHYLSIAVQLHILWK